MRNGKVAKGVLDVEKIDYHRSVDISDVSTTGDFAPPSQITSICDEKGHVRIASRNKIR